MAKIHKNLHNQPVIRTYIDADYTQTHQRMLDTTLRRIEDKITNKNNETNTKNLDCQINTNPTIADELWIVEHNNVYTLGQAGKPEHILERGDTPIIQTDRGGQVTWHGKGQLVVYWLFDLEGLGWSVRDLVSHAEQSIEDVINDLFSKRSTTCHYYAHARQDAPGVYIYSHSETDLSSNNTSSSIDDNAHADNHVMLGKIASLGFKIKRGFSYHGIAINLDCDLSVFNSINPCGYAGMQMLRLSDFVELNSSSDFSIGSGNSKNSGYSKNADANSSHPPVRIDKLDFTQQLLNNICDRYAGKITLR